MSMNTVPERLAALRAAMDANGVDLYLIPVGDPHSSEYLPDHYTSLTYFSGFHGENSNFVVTRDNSVILFRNHATAYVRSHRHATIPDGDALWKCHYA